MRLVVLLRGVNLARNRRLAMADLRSILEGLGYEDAVTHLQSGNAVVTSRKKPATVKRELERALADELGLETEVFVRTRDELAGVVRRDPLGDVADNPSRYLVTFLSGKPSAALKRAAGGDGGGARPGRRARRHALLVAPERAAALEAGDAAGAEDLGVSATSRNWNTVTRLLAIADG